uniref:DNA topoisomerase 1 n=1 Tax=Fervidobacterium thailandense TaxID=1008305 RepID=A0A7C5RJC9_9BACT
MAWKSDKTSKTNKQKKVIIVESPAKAKTIENILGEEYLVLSSKGHVRDLPQKDFGVDLKTLEMEFEIIPGKESVVQHLREVTQDKEVLLASDPDREGEAIAWHLSTLLNVKGKNRITFSEITPRAIKEAVQSPREIDMNKVNAQLARRVLDRIVGYKISPLLWRIMKDAKSAGRVQSAALKIICERERERVKFVPQKFFKVWVEVAGIKAYLTKIDEKKLKQTDVTKEIAEEVSKSVREVRLISADVKEIKKNPPQPFITSTLQQDASSKLGFPVSKTMKIAQELYEGIDTPEGHIAFITYMRTDSVRISEEAKESAVNFITKHFGERYVGDGVRKTREKTKTKIQDAHECIRPVDVFLTPEIAKRLLDRDHYKLYELIWKRFIASQMTAAVYKQYSYDFQSGKYLFEATARERIFDGFESVYSVDDEKPEVHKVLKVNDTYAVQPKVQESETTPPDRFSEASLVKTLESEGIGRPSTYATIIQTLLDRKYVVKKRRSLIPTILGFIVNEYLEERFPDVVDKNFTAEMEKELDEIENGNKDWKTVVRDFLMKFSKDLANAEKQFFSIDYETDLTCECGNNFYLKVGKFGLYLLCKHCNKTSKVEPERIGVIVDGKAIFNVKTEPSEPDSVSKVTDGANDAKNVRNNNIRSRYPNSHKKRRRKM